MNYYGTLVTVLCCVFAFVASVLTIMLVFAKIDDRFTKIRRELDIINDKLGRIESKGYDIGSSLYDVERNIELIVDKLNVEEDEDDE